MDNEVHQLIAELAAEVGTAGPEVEGLRRAAKVVAANDEPVRAMLRAIATDPRQAAAIAADSYWHPNGFAKLVLQGHADPEFHLRLHVWPNGSPNRPMFEIANIHNHRWPFASVVLAGGLHVEYFEETREFDIDDPKVLPATRYSYAQAPGAPYGRLQMEGTVTLLAVGGNSYGWPERHSCEARELHLVTPFIDEFTATLLVQGETCNDSALVYQPLGRKPLVLSTRPVTPDEVVELAGRTVDEMAKRD